MNAGPSTSEVRLENQRRLLKFLYKYGAHTRKELCTKLQLSLTTINMLIKLTEPKNLLTFENSSEISTGGRIPVKIGFNAQASYAIGIELSLNYFRIIITDLRASIIEQQKIVHKFAKDTEYWLTIRVAVDDSLKKIGIPLSRVIGICFSVPGPVFHSKKKMESWLLQIKDFSIEQLEEIFKIPVFMENDANLAGFAEIWTRGDINDVVYVSVSHAVGGSIIRNSEIFQGQNNLSGEIGHMIIVPNGRRCLCGRKGCFDRYVSTELLAEQCGTNVKDFFIQKEHNNDLEYYWQEYLDYLSIGISNILFVHDIPVILGGEIAHHIAEDPVIFNKKLKSLDSFERDTEKMYSFSVLGENGPIIGAALLAISNYLKFSM